MFKINYDKKITMVQGDTGVIRMRIHNYELSQGDEVRFAIVNKANPSILLCQHSDKKIVLEKQVTVFEKDGSARIVIQPYDTEYLQPGKYLYEIQVKTKDGRVDTVVPLTSFTLMDGSIQGEYGQTTPSKPEPTPSEIELRFKRLEEEVIPALGGRVSAVENEMEHVKTNVNSVININDFPKLEDDEDDTNRIKRAIDYSIKLIENKGKGNHKIIEFSSGIYTISDTINIPNFIKIKSIGNVIFNSKVKGAMFSLYTDPSLNIDATHFHSQYEGSWINGLDGGITITRDSSIAINDTIALAVGSPTVNSGAQFFSGWWSMNDLTIVDFDIGIQYNSINLFLGKTDRALITKCNKALYFNGVEHFNSGESITFNDCIFGDNKDCAYLNWKDLELNFIGCSFDFVERGLYTSSYGVYRFTNCHFEGIGFTNTMAEKGGADSAIVQAHTDYWSSPTVIISGCDIMSIRDVVFKTTHKNGMDLIIDSLTTKGSKGFNKLFAVCDDNVNVCKNNFIPNKYLSMVTQNKLNVKSYPNFESIDIGTQIIASERYSGYIFDPNFNGKTTVTNSKSYGSSDRSLKIAIPSSGFWGTIKSEEFSCKTGDRIINLLRWYAETSSASTNTGRIIVKSSFYDKDGALIDYPSTTQDYGSIAASSTNNEWNRPWLSEFVIAPAKAVKFVVVYTINPTVECNLYLGGFYTTIY